MTAVDPNRVLVCVEKGRPTDEELAAVTVALLARAADDGQPGAVASRRARWHICAHCLDGDLAFRAPHSWHAVAVA